jgi:hypothetical protein
VRTSPSGIRKRVKTARPVGADDEVALEGLLLPFVGEPDRGPVAVDALHTRVGDAEPDVAAIGEPLGDEVLQHLVLGVNRHGPATGGLEQVDPVQLPAEGEVDPVVDEPVAAQPVTHAGLGHQVHGALFQHPGLDGLLDVVAGAQVDHHGLDPAQVQQVRQHQPGGPGADDSDLYAHDKLLS